MAFLKKKLDGIEEWNQVRLGKKFNFIVGLLWGKELHRCSFNGCWPLIWNVNM